MLLLKRYSSAGTFCLVLLIFHLHVLVLVSSQTTGDIKFTGYGSSSLGGLLEVYLNGSWGTVCGNKKFDLSTASVACRQMGLGPAIDVVYYPDLRFGVSDKRVSIGDLVCTGHESHLLRCHYKTAETLPDCLPYHNMGIMCSASVLSYPGSVHIDPIPSSVSTSSGLLQLYSSGERLNVCHEGFTLQAANSACKQLGYTSVKKYTLHSFETPLPYSWKLDSVGCGSGDSCLSTCISAVKISTCNQGILLQCGFDPNLGSSVPSGNRSICKLNTPFDGDIRTLSLTDDGLEGVPEIYTSDHWAKICLDGFDLLVGDVVCKQLGYIAAVRYEAEKGQGSGVQFSCSGIESTTRDCQMTVQSHCSQFVDLRCMNDVPPYGSLRLFNGSGSAGSLHLFDGSLYIPLCDHSFSNKELAVACRQLGYEKGVQVINNTLFGLSKFTTVPYNHTFRCSGDEAHLLDCKRMELTTSIAKSVCRDPYDAVSVQCGSSTRSKSRLVSGNSSSGILQVELNGHWGTVCGLGFTHYEAHVACREMGFATSSGFNMTGQPISDTPIHLTSFLCSGFESDLLSCPHQVADNGTCQHDHDVYLHCSNSYPIRDGSIRLVGDSRHPYTGRLEIMYHGLWMSVCGKLFQQETANVVCRQLGYTHVESYCTDACNGNGSGQIFFGESVCRGDESELIECETDIHNKHLCGHQNDVGITCSSNRITNSVSSSPSPSPSTSFTIIPATEPTTDAVNPSPSSLLPFSEIYLYVILGTVPLLMLVVLLCAMVCCTYMYRKKKQRRFRGNNSSRREGYEESGTGGVDQPDLASPRAINLTYRRNSPPQSSDDTSMADLKERDSLHKDTLVELGSFGIDVHSDVPIELRDLNASNEGATAGCTRESSVGFEEVDFGVEAPPRYDEIDFKSSSVIGNELLSPSSVCGATPCQARSVNVGCSLEEEKEVQKKDLKFTTITVGEL